MARMGTFIQGSKAAYCGFFKTHGKTLLEIVNGARYGAAERG